MTRRSHWRRSSQSPRTLCVPSGPWATVTAATTAAATAAATTAATAATAATVATTATAGHHRRHYRRHRRHYRRHRRHRRHQQEEPAHVKLPQLINDSQAKELVESALTSTTGAFSTSLETIISPIKDVCLNIGGVDVGPAGGTDFAVVVERMAGFTWEEDLGFTNDVIAGMKTAIRCVRGRAQRAEMRRYAANLIKEVSDG